MPIWDDNLRKGGVLIVLSGPSGVGKDSVLDVLKQIYPSAGKCVTMTTRRPRDGEVDGVDYTFVSVEDFKKRIDDGGFLEYAEVHGNFYGTPRAKVEENLKLGADIILKIDVQGAMAVKRKMSSAVLVFLLPPSMEELERRLRSRLTETDAELATRLANAQNELEQIPHYDYIVINDVISKAAEELKAVIIAEHCRIQQN